MTRRAAPLLLLLGGAALAAACAEAPTGAEPFAIAFERLPFPAVVVGDSLRDTSGAAAPLAAVVYDASGAVLGEAPVTYLLLDAGATLLDGGYVLGEEETAIVEVVAEAAGIPTQPLRLAVVPVAPDSLALLTTDPDTARYQVRDTLSPADTSERLEVQVLHVPAAGEPEGVASWAVRYDLALFAGTTEVENDAIAFMAGENGRESPLDTTDANGRAWRRVRLNAARFQALDAIDSVVVSVTILGRPAGTVRAPFVRVAVPVRSR